MTVKCILNVGRLAESGSFKCCIPILFHVASNKESSVSGSLLGLSVQRSRSGLEKR